MSSFCQLTKVLCHGKICQISFPLRSLYQMKLEWPGQEKCNH